MASAVAHTGSGIAVDHLGQVFFLDTGSGLWKIDTRGRLTKVSAQRYHWLALDANNRFASFRPSGLSGDITTVHTNPTLLIASDWPIAIGQDGNLYYPSGGSGQQRIMRVTPSGKTSVLAALPATVPHINGIASGPNGSIYFTDNNVIRRISAQGQISIVAAVQRLRSGPSIPGTNQHPYLRGLAVDARGVVTVADNGDARVLRITPGGKSTTQLQLRSPWSPTAVALFGSDVYVLEYLHTAGDNRLDWLPRVRKITSDGRSTIVAAVDNMSGSRR